MATAEHENLKRRTRPIYVIFGADEFLRARRLDEVLIELLGAEREETALATFEGDSAALADVLDECRTLSLWSSLRVVCVQEADKFVTEHRKSLEKYLESPCPTGVLILICRTWQKTTRLYKLVDQIGVNLECTPPKRREGYAAWVIGHTRQAYGSRLDPGGADRLVDLVGEDLGRLNMELAKLAVYVLPSEEIRQADVEALVGASRVERVFGITDAIARRDARQALTLWEQVLANDRDAPYRAVGGLAYGFRRLAEAKRLVKDGVSVPEVMSRMHMWADSRAFSRQLDRFSLAQWRDHLVRLLRIDLGAKTGLAPVQGSVEKFIVELCAAS